MDRGRRLVRHRPRVPFVSGHDQPAGEPLRAARGQEPLDLFRRYMSASARTEARCLCSPALITNLEANWDARRRSL